MKLTPRSRFITALVALSSVLFMQFAAAAYACPDLQLGKAHLAMSVADAPDVSMPECAKIDQEHANLCQSHCERASQSIDTLSHTAIEAPVLPLLAVLAASDVPLPAIKAAEQSELLTRVTTPPSSLRFCV